MVSACSGQTPDASASDSPEASSDATEQSDGQAADAAGEDEPADSSDTEKSSGPSKKSEDAASSDSAPKCSAADLSLAVDQGDSAAGHLNYTITFTNTGDQACTLNGHPGVSAVGDNDGTQIGASATREGEVGKAVVLIPNAHATAEIQAANIGEDGGPLGESCQATEADGWRIYPPDSKTSAYVEQDGLRACADKNADWLSVSAVEPVS